MGEKVLSAKLDKEEVKQLIERYEKLKGLVNIIGTELDNQRSIFGELQSLEDELPKISNGMESFVPLGIVYVKATLHNKVLVPLGANYFVAMEPKQAVEKVKEIKGTYESSIKDLEKKLAEALQELSAIEGKLAEVHRGMKGAGKTEKSPQEFSK
jgi:prefoldin alpha subunit